MLLDLSFCNNRAAGLYVPIIQACYAHNEYEFGIMKMFGGFGLTSFRKYHKVDPKTKPVDGTTTALEFTSCSCNSLFFLHWA